MHREKRLKYILMQTRTIQHVCSLLDDLLVTYITSDRVILYRACVFN